MRPRLLLIFYCEYIAPPGLTIPGGNFFHFLLLLIPLKNSKWPGDDPEYYSSDRRLNRTALIINWSNEATFLYYVLQKYIERLTSAVRNKYNRHK